MDKNKHQSQKYKSLEQEQADQKLMTWYLNLKYRCR